jgi:tetratricopeptide (TPR) repeat protein
MLADEGSDLAGRGGNLAEQVEYLIQLAEAQYRLGRHADAEQSLLRIPDAAEAIPTVKAQRRALDARIHARRRDYVVAEGLGRQAVAIADKVQSLNVQGQVYADLGEVLALVGKTDAARDAFQQALSRYQRKGNLVGAARVRSRLTELEPTAVLA